MRIDAEPRFPLEQPEGHVGVQVDFGDNDNLRSAHIVSRDPESTAWLGVSFPVTDRTSDDPEEDMVLSRPKLTVGWKTHLDSRGVIETIREVLPDRAVVDYRCVPPAEDKRYFWDENPYYTTSVDEVLKKERTELGIHFIDPMDTITWRSNLDDELYERHFAYNTWNSLEMTEETIRSLIEQTAAPEKRDAIIAALEPLKAFYAKYVAIDLHE